MSDQTESIRRKMMKTINADPGSREAMEAKHGQIWDTTELQNEFQVLSFLSPLVVVENLETGVRGSLYFQHSPRYYYGFQPE